MDPKGTLSLLEETADHVVPARLRGLGGRVPYGSSTVRACYHCNNIKGEMSPDEWLMFMRDNPRWWEMPEHRRNRGRSKVATAIASVQSCFPGAQVVRVRT
jgi:5-methylcytosine-specific restriction endonuclease McrA